MYLYFLNVVFQCVAVLFLADVRRGFTQMLADVAAVTLSSHFSTPIIILVCVKNPVPEWSGTSTWAFHILQ